jgi:hypothetical protein
LSWTSSASTVDSCHVHSSSPLAVSDQLQGVGYSESEVETDDASTLELETDATPLELETNAAPLELEMDVAPLELETETETNMSQEISR